MNFCVALNISVSLSGALCFKCSSEDLTLLCCLQISTCHQLLHPQVLQLLVKLFETEHSQLDVMEQVILRGFRFLLLHICHSFCSHSRVNVEVVKM